LIAILGGTSNHNMETPTPETPAMNAGCVIPLEAEPQQMEYEELPEDVAAILYVCDENGLGYKDRLTIASALISDVTEEFEQDILTYVEETPAAEVDPFIVANTSQVIERLRVAAETLATVSIEDFEGEDEDDDQDSDID
jgi:hypothetical protein